MHEILSISRGYEVIFQHGINDIIHPVGLDIIKFRLMSDLPSSEDLISGIEYYKNIDEELNLKFIVGTLLPIYNWRIYAPFREDLKKN